MTTTQRKFVRHGGPYLKVRITFPKTGRTKQSFAYECEINNIMAKYQKTGAIAHVNQHAENYDFASSLDFADAMRLVVTAQDMFNGLPSSIRSRFANDPAQFLDFVQDADNEAEMKEMGLIEQEQTPEKTPDVKKTEPPTPPIPDKPPEE